MIGEPERYCLWQKVAVTSYGAAFLIGVATLWWVWTEEKNKEGGKNERTF